MASRIALFREELKIRNTEAAIITDEINIGYLCGYRYTDGFLLIDDRDAYLVTDGRYSEEAALLAEKSFIVSVPEKRMAFVREFVEGKRNLGYEERSMTVETFHRYQDELGIEMVPLGDILSSLRAWPCL